MPACKLCIAYIIGIIISDTYDVTFSIDLLLLGHGLVILISLFSYRLVGPLYLSIICYSIFILLGLMLGSETNLLPKTHFSNYKASSKLKGTVTYSKGQKKSDQYWLKIDSVYTEDRVFNTCGKLMVSIYPSSDELYMEGSQLLIPSTYQKIDRNPNPHTFDYKSFMARSDIFHYMTISSSQVELEINTNTKSYYQYLGLLRHRISRIFNHYLEDSAAKHILLALTLGEKSAQLDGIKQDYIKTGTVHVLAISGLHVGTLAGVFLMLLKRVSRTRKSFRLVIILFAVITVWSFACLSGLSQSVSRAALMFSLIICGQFVHHKINVLNIVGLSALLLLIIDPNNLYSVSFQFSYLAVISIILFYSSIRKLLPEFSKVFKYALDLFAVSCAAQILITPLSILYFNQFSFIGIFLSVIVVPLTAVILQSALLGLLCVFTHVFIGKYLLMFAEKIILIQNALVKFCAKIPISHLENLWINWTTVCMIYVFILGLLLYQSRFQKIILWILFSWFAFAIHNHFYSDNRSFYFYKYELSPFQVQDLVLDGVLISVHSDELSQKLIDFNIKPNRLRLSYKTDISITESKLNDSDIVCCFSNKSICISKSYPIHSTSVHDYVWRVDLAAIYDGEGQLLSDHLIDTNSTY